MINQIECGRCKPSYDTARKIFEILTSLEQQHSAKASDICSRELISVYKNETLHTAITKMRSNSVSQVPVFDGSRVIGLISEDGLARNMIEKEEKQLGKMLITVMMDPPTQIVDEGVPGAIISLVRFSKCVLVSEKEQHGIITFRHSEDGRITPSSYDPSEVTQAHYNSHNLYIHNKYLYCCFEATGSHIGTTPIGHQYWASHYLRSLSIF
jgi:predicted transcriptional regulator